MHALAAALLANERGEGPRPGQVMTPPEAHAKAMDEMKPMRKCLLICYEVVKIEDQ